MSKFTPGTEGLLSSSVTDAVELWFHNQLTIKWRKKKLKSIEAREAPRRLRQRHKFFCAKFYVAMLHCWSLPANLYLMILHQVHALVPELAGNFTF